MKNRALLRSNSISGLGGVLASFLFIKENQVGLDRSNGNRAGVVLQLVQDGGGNPYL